MQAPIKQENLGGTKILYHITSVDSAKKILASGKMLRGKGGTLGAGIYFAENEEACRAKARFQGATIEAEVFVEISLVPRGENEFAEVSQMTYKKLINEFNCHSVKAEGLENDPHPEYCVYSGEQIRIRRVWTHSGEILFDNVRPVRSWAEKKSLCVALFQMFVWIIMSSYLCEFVGNLFNQ